MRILATLFLVFILRGTYGQTIEETFKKTLWCPNDTLKLSFSNYPQKFAYQVSTNKISPGTDASPNLFVTLYNGNDSSRISYHNNIPYAHIIYVKLESPKGKSMLRLHFNDIYSYFSNADMTSKLGQVQFNIPEPYELANIIWTLSPSGQKATDLNKEGDYYKRMMAWFKPYLTHPIFKALSFPDTLYYEKYYEFRENSFAFNFKENTLGLNNTKLLFNGPYYYVYGKELADSSLFGRLKPLVEDFALKSKFRQFYVKNGAYYQQQLERQRRLLPIKQMWTWLEIQFPKRKYQSYRIISSPLIGGSHSTQRYSTPNNGKWFSENVMFICGTDRYDRMQELTEKQREGLMSGIVFTEIDHNYVNPVTSQYGKQIDSVFSSRNVWAKTGNASDYYGKPVSVFNEYMTHAAFCLYIADNYEEAVANYVISNREDLMVNRRNFIRFKAFNQYLLSLHREHKELKVVDLYPMVITWCKAQTKA